MGKTAIRLWKKMALVEPVQPKTGKDGFTQPGYLRGRYATRLSPKVRARNSCIAMKMHEKKQAQKTGKFSGRYDVIQAFKDAVKECKAAGQ
jgi:hypothetical protein